MLLSRYGRLVFAKLKTSLLSSYVRKIIIGVKFELNVIPYQQHIRRVRWAHSQQIIGVPLEQIVPFTINIPNYHT
jgi:hypothetical protein